MAGLARTHAPVPVLRRTHQRALLAAFQRSAAAWLRRGQHKGAWSLRAPYFFGERADRARSCVPCGLPRLIFDALILGDAGPCVAACHVSLLGVPIHGPVRRLSALSGLGFGAAGPSVARENRENEGARQLAICRPICHCHCLPFKFSQAARMRMLTRTREASLPLSFSCGRVSSVESEREARMPQKHKHTIAAEGRCRLRTPPTSAPCTIYLHLRVECSV